MATGGDSPGHQQGPTLATRGYFDRAKENTAAGRVDRSDVPLPIGDPERDCALCADFAQAVRELERTGAAADTTVHLARWRDALHRGLHRAQTRASAVQIPSGFQIGCARPTGTRMTGAPFCVIPSVEIRRPRKRFTATSATASAPLRQPQCATSMTGPASVCMTIATRSSSCEVWGRGTAGRVRAEQRGSCGWQRQLEVSAR